MTIEEKALALWSRTHDPCLATWMLKDGTLLNGSYKGYARDVDHVEINQFFKRSKHHEPDSAVLYVKKFLRRGNIRVCCNKGAFLFETVKAPTEAQMERLEGFAAMADKAGIPFGIKRIGRKGKPFFKGDYEDLETYLAHYRKYKEGIYEDQHK